MKLSCELSRLALVTSTFALVVMGCVVSSAQETEQLAPPAEPSGQPVKESPEKSGQEFEPERVIARVGDTVITAREYQRDLGMRWMAEMGPAARTTLPDADFRGRVMREMIDARVVKILAANSGIEVSPEQVREEYERGRRRFPNDEAFKAYMEKFNLTPDRLMEEMRARLQVDAWTKAQAADEAVTEEEIKARYSKIVEAGQARRNSPTADVAQILIMPAADSEDAWEAARAKAEAARQRILDGETFEEVAKDVSQDPVSAERGGRYDEAVPGLVGPEISQRMMEQELNTVSEPFRSTVGWHIMTVTARYEPGTRTLEEMSDEILTVLVHEKRMTAVAKLVADARRIIRIELTPEDE